MIKEKSKNRLTKLEDKFPKYRGKDVKIECTDEARSMLEPYADWFNTMEGKTLVYTPKPNPNVISTYTPVSVTIGYPLWLRVLGNALAVISTQDFYALPEAKRPIDMRGMPKLDIDKRVAMYAIGHFTEMGIIP